MRVQTRVQERELRRNDNRLAKNRPVVSAGAIVRLIDRETAIEVKKLRAEIRAHERAEEAAKRHKPMADMDCDWVDILDAAPIKLLHAQPQKGQVGWWIPTQGTNIVTFTKSRTGKKFLGGTPGDWRTGVVTNAEWNEESLPAIQIRYTEGAGGNATVLRLDIRPKATPTQR